MNVFKSSSICVIKWVNELKLVKYCWVYILVFKQKLDCMCSLVSDMTAFVHSCAIHPGLQYMCCVQSKSHSSKNHKEECEGN